MIDSLPLKLTLLNNTINHSEFILLHLNGKSLSFFMNISVTFVLEMFLLIKYLWMAVTIIYVKYFELKSCSVLMDCHLNFIFSFWVRLLSSTINHALVKPWMILINQHYYHLSFKETTNNVSLVNRICTPYTKT